MKADNTSSTSRRCFFDAGSCPIERGELTIPSNCGSAGPRQRNTDQIEKQSNLPPTFSLFTMIAKHNSGRVLLSITMIWLYYIVSLRSCQLSIGKGQFFKSKIGRHGGTTAKQPLSWSNKCNQCLLVKLEPTSFRQEDVHFRETFSTSCA